MERRKAVPPCPDFDEIVAKAQGGDANAFEKLYHLLRPRVYRQCLKMTGNVAVADEFTQESLLQIYRKIVTFRATSAFTTWSHRVVVNVVLMELRKRKIYAPVSLDESVETLEGESTPRHIQRPDLRLEGTIDRLAIDRAIETLPPGYRLVFILHDVEGYEHCEIADMLGCSVGNSKSQLYKARLSLRRKLMERFRPTRVAV